MKKITKTILAVTLALFGLSQVTNAQALFKDLESEVSTTPVKFININGSMYIHTNSGGFNNQIWKSDGTADGTVILKDSILISNAGGDVVQLLNMNNTLYYVVNPNGGPYNLNKATLWKSDGTTAGTVLIDSLITKGPFMPNVTGHAQVRNFTLVGDKLFFQMGQGNGLELWVTDGSVGGAHEVVDLIPGYLSGIADQAMVAYNGKLYFSAESAYDDYELYTSDGTKEGTVLVKDINANYEAYGYPFKKSSEPTNFIVYNNALYFYAKSGSNHQSNGTYDMWKTDGTDAGTTMVVPGEFGTGPTVFKNELYFGRSTGLWKTNGTLEGTVLVTDSTSTIEGANADYLIVSYATYLPKSPYIKFHYRSTDGVTTTSLSETAGQGASFVVLNNKMYGTRTVRGLFVCDGTEAGGAQLSTNISQSFHVFNGNLYYNGWTSEPLLGYELWWYDGTSTTGINEFNNKTSISVYPNPSKGIFTCVSATPFSEIKIYNLLGESIYTEKNNATRIDINLTEKPKGVYLYSLTDNNQVSKTGKIIIE